MEESDILTSFFDNWLAPVWHCFDFVFAHLPLPSLCVVLGVGFCIPQIYGLKDPKTYASTTRRFPRSLLAGYVLMALATLWFLYYVRRESLADFINAKKYMMLFFLAVGVGVCIFVREFLAVRGAALVFMLLAKFMVDTGRPHLREAHLVLVIQAWAYLLVLAGIWLTISPWRLREFVEWGTANEKRIRLGCGIRLVFGLFVTVLGFTAF